MQKLVTSFLILFCANGFAMSTGEIANNLGASAAPPGYGVQTSSAIRRVSCILRRDRSQLVGLSSRLELILPAGVQEGVLGIDGPTGYEYRFEQGGQIILVRAGDNRFAVYSCHAN